jgi:hypothetical protein
VAGCCECGDEPSGSGATELGLSCSTVAVNCVVDILISSQTPAYIRRVQWYLSG